MSTKQIANERMLVCENPSNHHTGFRYVLWEGWKYLPVWLGMLGVILTAMMAMLYFNPSRPWFIVTAIFPLSLICIFWYARYSSDPDYAGNHDNLSPIRLSFTLVGVVVAILLVFILVLRPVWNSEVVVKVTDFYPAAQVGQTDNILDVHGSQVLDADGHPLVKNKMMTAPDGRQYKVEGMLLINLDYKDKLATGFEIWNILLTILTIVHCWYFRWRWKGIIIFFGAALIYGFLLESAGVYYDFFRESNYHLYLPMLAAPVATMTGWPVVFYGAIFSYEMIERRWMKLKKINFVIIGLVISLIALANDLNLDPVATGLSLWTWNEILPPWYFGVPLVNFTSWLCAVFAFGAGYTFIYRRSWSEKWKIVAMFVMIPVLLIVSGFLNTLLCGLIEGFNGPVSQVSQLKK